MKNNKNKKNNKKDKVEKEKNDPKEDNKRNINEEIKKNKVDDNKNLNQNLKNIDKEIENITTLKRKHIFTEDNEDNKKKKIEDKKDAKDTEDTEDTEDTKDTKDTEDVKDTSDTEQIKHNDCDKNLLDSYIFFVINDNKQPNNSYYDPFYDPYYDKNNNGEQYNDEHCDDEHCDEQCDEQCDDEQCDDKKKDSNSSDEEKSIDNRRKKKNIDKKMFNSSYQQPNDPFNAGIENIFKDIISKINIKKVKKKDPKVSDDFYSYFKESKLLLPIDKEIKNLDDLIKLGETFNPDEKSRYVINLRALHKCVEPLKELNNMIGMKNVKEMIIDLIFFRLQNLEDNKQELWHMVIQGTPGSGKTEVAKILGKLYYSLGITKEDKFIQARRSDLIGKYLGHTAKNTQEIFDKAKGGVLFIDEAYSLGNPDNKDSFSKECIDTINQNLTENKDTILFIAGYKEQLEESFFSYNPGLNRRFKIRLSVDKYNGEELRKIFLKKISDNNWSVFNDDFINEIPLQFFEKNIGYFKYNGGDMENLWHFTKIVHARRIFGKSNDIVKKVTKEDLDNAFKIYSLNDEFKNRNESLQKYIHDSIYI
jgi:SpoVK/Ycf46/Vps4 family AAA+-type ATPase